MTPRERYAKALAIYAAFLAAPDEWFEAIVGLMKIGFPREVAALTVEKWKMASAP